MRTTRDIDDGLTAAAQEVARRERTTAGRVVSRLLRHSAVAGFVPFPAPAGVVVTNEQVDRLREAEGI